MMIFSLSKFIRSAAILLLLAAIAALMPAQSARAAEAVANEPGALMCSTSQAEAGNCNCREKHPGYLLSVIVPCLRDEVIKVTKRTTNEFAPYLQGAVGAFLTLVLTVFGVQILMAEGDPKKDGFILLVKIAAVIGFLASYDTLIIDPAFGTLQAGVELTTSVFNITAEHCQEYLTKYPNAEVPWIHYDCVLGKLIGFGGTMIVGSAAIGLASAALFSGQFGTVFFMGAVASIFFLLKLIIRGVYSYLMAIIALGLLIFISPLLIPLIWMPATQQYFDRWLAAVVAMIIMPAIIMAYLTLSFMVLEKIVFDEEMGIATLLSQEKAEELRMPPNETANTHVAAPASNDIDEAALRDESQFNWMAPIFSGNANANLFSEFYHIDFRSDEAGQAGKLFFGFVALLLVTYILMAMFEQIISLAQVMVGGGFFMEAAVSDNMFEKTITNVQTGMQDSMNKSMSGASGFGGKASAFASGLAQGIIGIPRAVLKAMNG